MQDFLLLFITVLLLIIAVELSIALFYAIIFLQNTIIIIKRIKVLEEDFEEKIKTLESGLSLIGGKMAKGFLKNFGKFFKK